MDNSGVLAKGTAKAKKLIAAHLLKCMNNALDDVVADEHRRMSKLPGMTGNTRTSPAGATYANGMFDNLILAGDTFARPPLRSKLRNGQIFPAGAERYDGDIQEYDFVARLDTTGNTSQEDNYDFLEAQQMGKEIKMVVTGATEYLGNDQVTESYQYAQSAVTKHFQPLPD